MSKFANNDFNPDAQIPFDGIDFAKKETIFIWIDILGFKDKLKDGKHYDELALLLDDFQRRFKEREGFYRTTIISDGIVLELNPKREKWNFENVQACFNEIKRQQLGFVVENKCVVRGAIVVGTSRLKKNGEQNYISNGLSFAYELESKGINWPVIGTNKIFFDKMNLLYKDDDRESPFDIVFKKTLTQNGDDVYFLDIYSDLKGEERKELENIIQDQLQKQEKCRSVYNKYIWLYKCMHGYKGSKEILNRELEEVIL